MRLSRRNFIQVSGAAGLGAMLPMHPSPDDKLKRIGIQLYTVRQALDADFAGTLERLAAIGYQEVEFAWNRGATPAETRNVLQENGLTAPAAHLAVEDFETGWNSTVSAARTLGVEYLVLAWIDAEQRKTLDDYRQWAERFNRFGTAAREAGFKFAYHNHAGELSPINGQVPYDILLGGSDPATVGFEMDIFWVLEGGGNPLTYFAAWPGRFPLLHIKGRTADGTMVDVGAGSVDWAAIFGHAKQAGVRHSFVEHDDATDPLASAAASYAYLRQLRFKNE
ncbi:MAG: sugar phosphate isomerase/epimerase [Gemmatimonadales bacterium]